MLLNYCLRNLISDEKIIDTLHNYNDNEPVRYPLLEVQHEELAEGGEDVPAVDLAGRDVVNVGDGLVDAALGALVHGEGPATLDGRLGVADADESRPERRLKRQQKRKKNQNFHFFRKSFLVWSKM